MENKTNRNEWTDLVALHPELVQRGRREWRDLDGDDWRSLLAKHPQFAHKCDWKKFHGFNWYLLLAKQPQFADKCDWAKLDGNDWRSLLSERPQFADKCDWAKLDGNDWRLLLEKQPQFADKRDWTKLGDDDWRSLLSEQPQFADKRGWEKFDGHDWVALLQKRPECADKCDKWDQIGTNGWEYLLCAQPQFADKCDKWDQFDTECWEHLLRAQPQFADKCDKWDSFESLQLFNISCDQPSLFDKVRECRRGDFDGPTWVALLCYQPQLADRCNWWNLDYIDWVTLLSVPDPLQLEFRCSVGRGWLDTFAAIEYIPQSDDALRRFHGKDGPCYFKKLKWEDIPLRIVSFLLRLWPSFTETAKRQKNVKGKILEILFDIPADKNDTRAQRRVFPMQLWRQHVAAGDRPEDEPGGPVSSMESSWYAEATPGNAEIRVFLDGDEVFRSPLDFSNPNGLAFKDCGFLFDESHVDDDGLVYSSRKCLSEAASWEPMVVEVPSDFKFEPEKLFVPFYRARVSGKDGPRLLVRPSGIRYGDMKQAEWFPFDEHPELVMENPSYVCSFWPVHWTVSEGAAKPYDEDDWWEP